jgi:hypothetical protein
MIIIDTRVTFCARSGKQIKKALIINAFTLIKKISGERGIRTPGPVTVNGFQDRRIRPLCHLSAAKIGAWSNMAKWKINEL